MPNEGQQTGGGQGRQPKAKKVQGDFFPDMKAIKEAARDSKFSVGAVLMALLITGSLASAIYLLKNNDQKYIVAKAEKMRQDDPVTFNRRLAKIIKSVTITLEGKEVGIATMTSLGDDISITMNVYDYTFHHDGVYYEAFTVKSPSEYDVFSVVRHPKTLDTYLWLRSEVLQITRQLI